MTTTTLDNIFIVNACLENKSTVIHMNMTSKTALNKRHPKKDMISNATMLIIHCLESNTHSLFVTKANNIAKT